MIIVTSERLQSALTNALCELQARVHDSLQGKEALDVMYAIASQDVGLFDEEIAALGFGHLLPGNRWYIKAIEAAKANDWAVSCEGDDFTFSKFSPAGQDFMLAVEAKTPDELLEEIERFYESYDPEEEALLWVDPVTGKGKNGAPYSLKDVIKDMEDCEKNVEELFDVLKAKLRDVTEQN